MSTSKDIVIARQAEKIELLEKKLEEIKDCYLKIHAELYAIGAPLNDNTLGYTRKQLNPFFAIASENDAIRSYLNAKDICQFYGESE